MRRATANDLHTVNELLAISFGPDRVVTIDDLNRPELHIRLSDDGFGMSALYLARDAGRWTAHATSMCIHPDARGRGLAHQLVDDWDHIMGHYARELGPLRLFGYSNPTRKATEHLLAGHGWKHIGQAIGDHGSNLWARDYK